MNPIVPFESAAQLPAYLQNNAAEANADLLAHASASYPVMSIKGKIFTLVRGDEKQVVPNPKDPESPAHSITVAVAKVSPHTSKSFYLTAFKEGEENVKPACFSNDGVKPDVSSEHPQCATCAACKWNVFGTARGENGKPGKGKACSDFVRMAILDLTALHDPILLRVPPASIKAVGEFGRMLAKRKVPYQAVATQVSFVMEEATPRLQFKPVGYLDEASYREVMEESKSDTVEAIIMGTAVPGTANAEPEIPQTVVAAPSAPLVPPANPAPSVPPVPPVPSTADVAAAIVDQAVAETRTVAAASTAPAAPATPAAPAAAPAPQVPAKQTAMVDSDPELADILSGLGFDE